MEKGEKRQPQDIAELLAHIQSGSSGAFVKLSEQYAPLLESEVARYAGILGSADLEDLRQGALVSLYRAALAYQPDRGVTFGLFAKICIVNGIADTLRYIGKKSVDVSMELLGEDEQPEGGENPQSLMLDKEQAQDLRRRIRFALSEMEYRIFDLYLSGYSYAEIADIIGKTTKSVDNALHRVKDKLKKIL
ncbi:MAG: sigma-70 family RNA polymerase sigma factor [Clostridia bacterium]|nr:sigma-70 family RNA polymerase sigma factor [Clostridia bacterium]